MTLGNALSIIFFRCQRVASKPFTTSFSLPSTQPEIRCEIFLLWKGTYHIKSLCSLPRYHLSPSLVERKINEMITIVQHFCMFFSIPVQFKVHVFVAHHEPWPAFLNCSLLPLPPTLFVTICISFLWTISSTFFNPLHQAKAWTLPNIPLTTSSLSSSSQARTSPYFSFTASFGFVIFNTI